MAARVCLEPDASVGDFHTLISLPSYDSLTAETVFVVERDDDLRARLSRYLSESGFAVRGFSSAESFLETLPIRGPACVVVDQHLPGLSGPDLQRQLRDNPTLAIVFTTDSGDVSTVAQAMVTAQSIF
jgi:FixJ family two-component response regulator